MTENNSLNLKFRENIESVEDFKFEPIKGYPMLQWKGKRPFTSTQFYPAQLKETHGEETEGWLNKIFWGDNLQVMSHLLKEYRGQIDLIYIDPPYDSKADYKRKIRRKGREVSTDSTSFEEKQYTDIWTNDEYLQFMYERLILMRELLSDSGTIYVHCDWHKVHHLRCIMDEIFGNGGADAKGIGYKGEIIWKYSWGIRTEKVWNRKHDNILMYSKSVQFTFNANSVLEERQLSESTLKRLEYSGALIKDVNNRKEELALPSDVIYVATINGMAKEKQDYPTQKPEELIEKFVLASSNPGDVIFDCFMGSGTTQAVAMKLGRKFIGADINLGAIQTTTKRLINIANELNGKIHEETKYTGFQVYNVNHYDVFRNPLEAKDLLIKALEIQPIPNNSLFDGEKDGKMVKIMPINRIATRADLNELITNFDYKKFEKLHETNPLKAVETILLVCMGHEPDLAAQLQNAVSYKLEIEVVDILRDKSNLEFKRDSEAEVVIEGGKLLIREFYPMNLLQKLSLMKENVENWKELTDSVMIDFNYDGSIFEPQIVDVPEGDNLVKGVYEIPSNAGTIHVKITDLLSESIELSIKQ